MENELLSWRRASTKEEWHALAVKSELAHFYTIYVKNLPGFKRITTLALPLFIKIGQNSTLNLLAYRPLTPS